MMTGSPDKIRFMIQVQKVILRIHVKYHHDKLSREIASLSFTTSQTSKRTQLAALPLIPKVKEMEP